MKKLICAALLMSALLLTGCSSEPMQPVEYAQAVMDNAQDYFDTLNEISFAEEMERAEFKALRKEAEAILKTVKKLSAPEEYSELHDKLCDGVEREMEWLELAERIRYSAGDKEDELAAEITELVSDPVFPSTVLEIAKAVDDDTDGAFLETLR